MTERSGSPTREWCVRAARTQDVAGIAKAVAGLLLELGGTPPETDAMEAVAMELVEDQQSGAVLVAEANEQVVGVLAASWQLAIHAPGRYALIQDLWVQPSWRSRDIGRELITALVELVSDRGAKRIEVGLPKESFASFASTEAFYLDNAFALHGPRMRRLL